MERKIAFVSGSTGLVGNLLVRNLINDDFFSEVITLARRELSVSHDKLRNIVVSFEDLPDYQGVDQVDIAFCCLGTTMKRAGSKAAFYRVDYDYVLTFAKYAKAKGCKQFFLVSAMGADKDSLFYYNRVKGQIEDAVSGLGFDAVHLMRPSLLLGDRQEKRLGEGLGKVFAKAFDFLIPENYKGVEASSVAEQMIQLAKELNTSGIHIHPSAQIRTFRKVQTT